jgi:hypothetical protein
VSRREGSTALTYQPVVHEARPWRWVPCCIFQHWFALSLPACTPPSMSPSIIIIRGPPQTRVAATAAAQLHPHLDSLLVGAAHVDVELGGCRRHLAYGSLHVLQAAQGRRVNAGRARDSTVRVRRGTRSPVAAIDAAAIAECRSRRCRCPSHDAAGAPRPACRRPKFPTWGTRRSATSAS